MSSTKASAKKRALNSDVSKSGKKLRVEEDDLFDPDLSRFVFISFFVSFPFLLFPYFLIFNFFIVKVFRMNLLLMLCFGRIFVKKGMLKFAVISKALCLRCIRSERNLRRMDRRRMKRLFLGYNFTVLTRFELIPSLRLLEIILY